MVQCLFNFTSVNKKYFLCQVQVFSVNLLTIDMKKKERSVAC